MSWHPTEEDLILHFYGENRGDEKRVDEHLPVCATCRDAWTELSDTLKLVDSVAVPEPDAGFERVMWARIRPALPALAGRSPWWSMRFLVPAAGVAAVIVAAIAVGRFYPSSSGARAVDVKPVATHADVRRAREQVLLTALGDHFEQAQSLLVELMNAPENTDADFTFERATAGDLVASGRLYRATARQAGDVRLAGMLDDLEAVLVDVARNPDRLNRADLKSLRARIDDASLLFKVRAVTNEIREREKRSVNSE